MSAADLDSQRRLQVKTERGWQWLFCRVAHLPMTTEAKHKALGEPLYAEADLAWARQVWPHYEFRLAQSLDD